MRNYKEIVNNAILEALDKEKIGNGLTADAMRYAVSTGGKRIRSQFLLRMLDDFKVDSSIALNNACAIEFIHTYSLIHDDLPAMDNDDYRRNQLTVHKKFREDIAILAGDAFLTYAFELVNQNPSVESSKISKILASCAGVNGMIFGQELDILSEEQKISLNKLEFIHKYKTGKLIAAPFLMAAIIANKEEYLNVLLELGYKLGLAFQIQDDILDVTKNLKKAGEVSSDVKNHKCTYVTYMDITKAQEIADELYGEVKNKLTEILKEENSNTVDLINQLIVRGI